MSEHTPEVAAHLATNLANWNDRAAAHATRSGRGYGVQRYIDDAARLSDVVSFDRERLGDIAGLRAVHLQCHIGTDTLSLGRLGARVTGLDFSLVSIHEAQTLVAETGDSDTTDFVHAEVYDAVAVLGRDAFDLVYTGIGALCWLPSIERWAQTVAALLKPGGRLFIRDGHPIMLTVDETIDDDIHLRFPYWEEEDPQIWDDDDSYVATDRPISATTAVTWNHGIGEIVTALIRAGLTITELVEHDSVPWESMPGQMTQRPDGEWALTTHPTVLPLTFTLQAVKLSA